MRGSLNFHLALACLIFEWFFFGISFVVEMNPLVESAIITVFAVVGFTFAVRWINELEGGDHDET